MPTEERTIRYYGILKPPEESTKAKAVSLTFDVIRPHGNRSVSKRTRPDESFYGYASLMYDGRVLGIVPLRFENQIIFDYFNHDLYLQQAISCSLEAVLTSFVNLGLSLGLPPIQRDNPIKSWENPTLPFDEVRLQLEAEISIAKLTLAWDVMETCSAGGGPPATKPPPTRQPPPKFPATAPDADMPPISPPYDGGDDNGNTYKPDDGGFPPETEEGRKYKVTVQYFVVNANPQTSNVDHVVWGKLGNMRFGTSPVNGAWGLWLNCHGDGGGAYQANMSELLLEARPGDEPPFQWQVIDVQAL